MRTAIVDSLPLRTLTFSIADGEIVPAWLGDRDRPWLRDLLATAEGFVGKSVAALRRHWRLGDRDPRAGSRQTAAEHVLCSWLARNATGSRRSSARLELFALAAIGIARDVALAEVAARHGLPPAELGDTLYDDLGDRRRIVWPEPAPDPTWLGLATNLAMVRTLLRFANRAEVALEGASRTLLRTAWLLGAWPTVDAAPHTWTTLRLGPGTALRRVLPALVPLLPWCRRFRLRSRLELPTAKGDLVLATGDALLPGPEPRRFDSRLERWFAADCARVVPTWRCVREPAPLATEHGIAFPDFLLQPGAGREGWFVEIAGLRDATALPSKLALLEASTRLVLCLPRRSVPARLVAHPRVVPFTRRIDVGLVRAIVDA